MSLGGLAFTPDRRSGGTSYFQFSSQMGFPGRAGFSQLDSLSFIINKEYENYFKSQLAPEFRQALTEILVKRVPIVHHNYPFLITANYLVNQFRTEGVEFTPEYFEKKFREVLPILQKDFVLKKDQDLRKVNAQYKATLYRYVIYIMIQLNNWDQIMAPKSE